MEKISIWLSWVLPFVRLCFSLRGFWPFLLPGFSLICTVLYHTYIDMYCIYSYIRQCFFTIFSLQGCIFTECVSCCVHLWPHQVLRFFFLIFCWPCISLQILGNNQLDALFQVFIYFMSLHVPSVTELIIRRWNCINTSSGMISLCKWLLGMPVRMVLQFPPHRHTKQSLTQTKHTRWCINTIRSPDDEHCDARN